MKASLKSLALILASTLAYAAIPGAVFAVNITYNSVVVYANGGGGNPVNSFSGTNIPTNHVVAASDGTLTSSTTVNYAGTGDQVTLSHSFDLHRSGGYFNYSQGLSSTYFTVATDSTYDLSGAYQVVDGSTPSDGSNPSYVYFGSYLHDIDYNVLLFANQQISQQTANEHFYLGGSGGDLFNYLDSSGSPTGMLFAGRTYEWHINAYTQAYPDGDGGTSSTGFATLKIGGGAPTSVSVPDDGPTLALLGLALGGVAAAWRHGDRKRGRVANLDSAEKPSFGNSPKKAAPGNRPRID